MAAESEAAGPGRGPRGFGLATATFVVVSSMVGTGVLTTSGYTMYSVGSNQWMLALWVLGGVVAVCGALSLAELSAALPESGGDYIYLREAYGPLVAFLSGWVSFFIGFGGPIAVNAFASAKYLLGPLGLPADRAELIQKATATGMILVLATVHASSRGGTVRLQGTMTVLKLGILGSFAALCLAAGRGRWDHLDDRLPLDADRLAAMAFSLVYIGYAYTGWNAASYLAGEVEDPQRRLPRAILLGTGLVIVLYLALNTGFALALSIGDVRAIVDATGDPPDVDVVAPIAELSASRLFGPRVSGPMSVAIGLTLLASVSAYVLTGPRVACAMALDGRFPRLAAIRSGEGAPVAAIWLQVAWAMTLLWTGSFRNLLTYASVGLAMFSMLAIAAVYVLRIRRPDLPRPFRTPGYPVTPGVFLAVTGLLTASAFRLAPWISLYSLLSILAGVPIYLIWFRGATPSSGPGGPEAVER